MPSRQYFNFIGTVWDFLPEEDKERMGEYWLGLEQVFASVYQKFAEVDLNIAVNDMVTFSTERWLPYVFDETTAIERPAVYVSTQDLASGVNLLNKYLIRFSVDGGAETQIDLRGSNPQATTITEIINKINTTVGYELVQSIFENTILQFTSPTSDSTSRIKFVVPADPTKDASEFVLGLLQTDLPHEVPEYPYVFSLPYERVAEIPELRNKIRDESLTINLEENINYAVEAAAGLVTFKEAPPANMWAKRTLIDDETPFNNFGFLMDIYEPNSVSYLSVVQGLWYAFWTGPKPENLKRSLYLLFGLPVAQEISVVTKVTSTEIETTSGDGIIRTFEIPDGLVAVVVEGESVERFQPLVSGIEVFDKINKPGFIKDEIGRAGIQRFLTENATKGSGDTDETKALTMLEEHTFLPQIDVNSFISPDINLANVKSFLEQIKPLNKTFLFQVIVGAFSDEIPVDDVLTMCMSMDVTPNVDSNQTTFLEQSDLDDYESNPNEGLNLDSDGVLLQESVEVEVRSFGVLIDSFDA